MTRSSSALLPSSHQALDTKVHEDQEKRKSLTSNKSAGTARGRLNTMKNQDHTASVSSNTRNHMCSLRLW